MALQNFTIYQLSVLSPINKRLFDGGETRSSRIHVRRPDTKGARPALCVVVAAVVGVQDGQGEAGGGARDRRGLGLADNLIKWAI